MKISIRKLYFGILFVLIIFNNVISGYISFFRFLDELIALTSMAYICVNIKSIIKKQYNTKIILCLFGITAIGVLGNLFFGYQLSVIAILKDMLAFYKMPVTFIAVYHWTEYRDLSEAHACAISISKLITIILFLGCVATLFTDLGLSYNPRYGFRTYRFLFSHPTFLVYALVLLSVVIVADQEYHKNLKMKYWFYHIQILFCLLFTFRDKAFGYIALFMVLIVFLPRARKIKFRYFASAGVLALIVSFKKLMEYRSWSWSPREALHMNGLQLMLKSFPLGSGFGTFNSSISGKYYSKAYYLFGLNKKPGMNPSDYIDLGDAQLPYYYAQFGVIGFILFVLLLFVLIKCIKNRYREKQMELKAAYLLLGYIAIGLLVEAVFTNESGATAVLVLLLYLDSKPRLRQKAALSH